jgi:hypothetical protein
MRPHVPDWTRAAVHSRAAGIVERFCLTAALLLALFAIWQSRQQVGCITNWADHYTQTANRRASAANERNLAQDDLLRKLNTALLDAINQDRAALARDLPPYKAAIRPFNTAAQAAKNAAERNPIPDSPALHC